MTEKNCLQCNTSYPKPRTRSKDAWAKSKYCSLQCRYAGDRGRRLSDEHKEKIRQALLARDYSHLVGKKHGHKTSNGHTWKLTEQQRKAISDRFRLKEKPNQSGPKNHKWKGGITPVRKAIKGLLKYKIWRKAVFDMHYNTCVLCGATDNLETDHIKPLAVIIAENKITNIVEAKACDDLWNVENGRVLCHKCHVATETYSGKVMKYVKILK